MAACIRLAIYGIFSFIANCNIRRVPHNYMVAPSFQHIDCFHVLIDVFGSICITTAYSVDCKLLLDTSCTVTVNQRITNSYIDWEINTG